MSGTDLELEKKCPICEGRGGADTYRGRWECEICNGSGFIPTEQGERILALVSHHLLTNKRFNDLLSGV
jgi:DnaJ-class molecular chaperone